MDGRWPVSIAGPVLLDMDTLPDPKTFYQAWTRRLMNEKTDTLDAIAREMRDRSEKPFAVPDGYALDVPKLRDGGHVKFIATKEAEADRRDAEFVRVPREPTDAMIWAGRDAWADAHAAMKRGEQRAPMTEAYAAILHAATQEQT